MRTKSISKQRSKNGRAEYNEIAQTAIKAIVCTKRSVASTPRNCPKRMASKSPVNESELETKTTPRANKPMNKSPIAVSLESFERAVMRPTPPIITTAPTAAPSIVGKPRIVAIATPGRTPWAKASPMKAIPRRTTYVPTTAHVSDTRIPANSARCINPLLRNGSIICDTLSS